MQLGWYCFQTNYIESRVFIYHGVAEEKLWVNQFVISKVYSLTSILT